MRGVKSHLNIASMDNTTIDQSQDLGRAMGHWPFSTHMEEQVRSVTGHVGSLLYPKIKNGELKRVSGGKIYQIFDGQTNAFTT